MAKNIRDFFENIFENYFWSTIVDIKSCSDSIIIVSTTLKYYHKQTLNKKLKIDGRGHEIFFDKITGS